MEYLGETLAKQEKLLGFDNAEATRTRDLLNLILSEQAIAVIQLDNDTNGSVLTPRPPTRLPFIHENSSSRKFSPKPNQSNERIEEYLNTPPVLIHHYRRLDIMSLGGVIFDWDGVVVDSSMIHKASWEDLARETKRELPENHFSMGFGKRNQVIIPEILKWTSDPEQIEAWGKRKEELYRQRAKIDGISLLPNIKPLLKDLQQSKISCAIGTSTELANLRLAFTQHPIENFFNGIKMPAICHKNINGETRVIREFDYEDFRDFLS